MATPRSILAAVDFGDASARAVAIAGSLARHCGATLRLMHAESFDAPPYFTAEQIKSLEVERRRTRAQAEQYLSTFGRSHTDAPFTATVDDRPPVDAILLEAATADLVVMGTHGRRGPKRWWLGSVAERVLRDVGRPLLVVRDDGPGSVEVAFTRAVVHATAPLSGLDALAYAREIAGCFGGQVVDARHSPVEAAVANAAASLLTVAMPAPATARWLADEGERLVRHCRVPILFVPDTHAGAMA